MSESIVAKKNPMLALMIKQMRTKITMPKDIFKTQEMMVAQVRAKKARQALLPKKELSMIMQLRHDFFEMFEEFLKTHAEIIRTLIFELSMWIHHHFVMMIQAIMSMFSLFHESSLSQGYATLPAFSMPAMQIPAMEQALEQAGQYMQ